MPKRVLRVLFCLFTCALISPDLSASDSVLESPSALHREDRSDLGEEDYLGERQKFESTGSGQKDIEADRWKPGPGYNPENAAKAAAESQRKGQK